MMLPTHVLVGLAVASPLLVVAPNFGLVGLVGALVGSTLPDLDMVGKHRRLLHYPTWYSIWAAAMTFTALLEPSAATVGLAFGLIGAALHSRMDRYGGGLELRPWEATSEQAVYDHFRGRWRAPKRWIRYDGAPEDVLVTGVLGVPLLFVLDGLLWWVVVSALLVGVTYGLVRRRLPDLAPLVFTRLPRAAANYVPKRFRT